jgi:hypothetical protein
MKICRFHEFEDCKRRKSEIHEKGVLPKFPDQNAPKTPSDQFEERVAALAAEQTKITTFLENRMSNQWGA